MEKMNIPLQQNLMTLLCYDDKAGKIIANLAEPDLFEGEYRTIVERALGYWKKHKRAPKVHTSDLFADLIESGKRGKTYQRILRAMLQLSEDMNSNYVVDQYRNFSRLQRMKAGIVQAAERLNEGEELALGEVETILADLVRARDLGVDTGIRLTDVDSIMNYLDSHFSEFRTGIKPLDQNNIVPARASVMLLLAPTGKGKTWFLCTVGKAALLLRKKVLHITLELDAEQTGQRYYQTLFSIPKHMADEIRTTRLKIKEGKVVDYRPSRVVPDVSFDDPDIRKHIKERVGRFKNKLGNLVIKQFPQYSLTMGMLRAYLDTLEAEGFVPDLLILDYIGITAINTRDPRLSLGRNFGEFRAICQERKIAGVTVQQVSKEGAKSDFVRATHVSEDWSLIHTADNAVTYSCTDAEEQLGLARLFVDKARGERRGWGVLITQSYDLGQFCLQSAKLPRDYFDYLKEAKAELGIVDDADAA